MVASFRRARKGGVSVTFGVDESRVLRHVLGEMVELLGTDAADSADEDPLAVAVGIGTNRSGRSLPTGPATTPHASSGWSRRAWATIASYVDRSSCSTRPA